MGRTKSKIVLTAILPVVMMGMGCASGKALRGPASTTSQAALENISAEIFPANYIESRARFRAACWQAAQLSLKDGFCRSHQVPSRTDDDLTIDHAYFSRGGNRLLVIQSGIHGSEAPAGAAIQELVFRKYLENFLDRGIDVYLIHAFNPYGFKHNRRTDEDNVNLNRNMSADGSIFRLNNRGYSKLRSMFEPKGPVKYVSIESLSSHVEFIQSLVRSGFDKRYISDAMNSGQYEFKQGLNFGGSTHQEQTRFMRLELAPIMARYPKEILFFDIHTGLGERGVLHVMPGVKPAPALFAKAKALLGGRSAEGILLTSTGDPGFYPTQGDMNDFVPSLAPDPERALSLTLEFGTMGIGTLDQLTSASRMILENQAHFHGCRNPDVCREVKTNFSELFNPSDREWRERVIRASDLVMTSVLENF